MEWNARREGHDVRERKGNARVDGRIPPADSADVALEMAHIDWVETNLHRASTSVRQFVSPSFRHAISQSVTQSGTSHQSGSDAGRNGRKESVIAANTHNSNPKPNISFSQSAPNEVVFPREKFLHSIERLEHLEDGCLVGGLGGGETGAVDAVWTKGGRSKVLRYLNRRIWE